MKTTNTRFADMSLWVLFFIWPLLALVSSIKNYREKWAKNGLWLFIVFYGYTFFSQEGNDSYRYIQYFHELYNSETSLNAFSGMFYSGGQRSVDIYGPLVAFLVSRFTDDSRVLLAVIALIFGYFYSRNIWFLLEKSENITNLYLPLFIIIFAFIIPIWSINGVRFWTASQVFFYGASRFLIDRKRMGLFFCVITVFIHFSFAIPILLLCLYLIIGNKPRLFLYLFLLGILVSEINIPVITQTMLTYTPSVFHERITDYTDMERIASKISERSTVNWYAIWHNKVLHIFIDVMLLAIYIKGKAIWSKRKELLCFFSFLLLFRAVVSFLLGIPTLVRFLLLNDFLSMGFIYLYFYYNSSENFSKRLAFYLIPFLFFFLIIKIRTGLDNTALLSFVSNPLIAPFLPNEFPLIDILK